MQNRYDSLNSLLAVWGEQKRLDLGKHEPRDERLILTSQDREHLVSRLYLRVGMVLLAVALLATATWAAVVGIRALLQEAAQLRQRLDAMGRAAGLDRSFSVKFQAEQPNTALVALEIAPALVRLAEVSYDEGASWKTLYDTGKQAPLEPVLSLEDKHTFTPPAAGTADVTARVRVQYIPAVLEAFPEYARLEKIERSAEFEVSAAGIKAIGATPAPPPPAKVDVDLSANHWELTNSTNATVAVGIDPKGRGLIVGLALKDVGEWATLSHSVPGATPANPTVSLKDLTHVEVQLVWDNPADVAMETKMVDDFGKITGIVKFLVPGKTVQTVRIPVGSMKPYFGVPQVNLSRIRRVEITFARKTPAQAAEGTVRIESVSLVSTKPLPATWKPPGAYADLETLSLRPDFWKTAKSAQGEIALAAEDGVLACKVNLPYDTKRDKELPWTSLWTQPQGKSFPGLQAIELEVRWDSKAPITIEPQLSMGSQGDTYGMQVRVRPSKDFQKVIVFPQDLKYFWTFAGESSRKGMDLGDVASFHLGITRKALDQADSGTLFIKAVRFLGPEKKQAGN